ARSPAERRRRRLRETVLRAALATTRTLLLDVGDAFQGIRHRSASRPAVLDPIVRKAAQPVGEVRVVLALLLVHGLPRLPDVAQRVANVACRVRAESAEVGGRRLPDTGQAREAVPLVGVI